MSFARTWGAIENMIRDALLETDTARDIARKAGVRMFAVRPEVPIMWGQLALAEPGSATGGYTVNYSSGVYSFPDGTSSMSRYGDLSDFGQGRLLVTIVSASEAGATLGVDFAQGASFSTPPSVSLSGATGLKLSEWRDFEVTGPTLLEWSVSSASETPGSFIVGLCQFQVK